MVSGCPKCARSRQTRIAFEINGLGYALLSATPQNLEDLALGFALSERLMDEAADLIDLDIFVREQDAIVRMTLGEPREARLRGRVRHRATDSSCDLCGIENLEELLRPLPQVTATTNAEDAAVFVALSTLENSQQPSRTAQQRMRSKSGNGQLASKYASVGSYKRK